MASADDMRTLAEGSRKRRIRAGRTEKETMLRRMTRQPSLGKKIEWNKTDCKAPTGFTQAYTLGETDGY